MEAKEFKNKKAKDQYGEVVTVFEVIENIARTDKGMYHVSNLFMDGKSLFTWLNEKQI